MNGLLNSSGDGGKAKPPQPPWVHTVSVSLKIGLVVAAVYLGAVYYQRWTSSLVERSEPQQVKRPADYYVYPPRSYVSDAASARKLIGKPLWVKEGYRWTYQPGDVTFEPLEKIIPTEVRERGGEVLLEFQKNGQTCLVPIGSKQGFYVDEIFFLKDPRELFDHWTPEIWQKVEARQVEPGMTEYQAAFALGAGNVVRTSPDQSSRVVDYTLRRVAGLQPLRVTFTDGIVERIQELPPES